MNVRASSTIPAATRRGFTLIELLTVIAIIGILALILIPVAGGMRASAAKASCTSNLRQLAIASRTFAADQKNQLPTRDTHGHRDTWTHPHVYHQDDFVLFRPYLGNPDSDREAISVLFCPGPLKQSISAESTNYNGGTGLFISYSYFNLKNLRGDIYAAYDTDERKTRRADLIPPRFPLWGCLTLTSGAIYAGHSEPKVTGGGFSGQNVAHADGSVRWHKGDELIPFATEGGNVYQGPRL